MPPRSAPALAPHVRAAQDALAHVAACLPLDFPEVRGAVHTCDAILGALVHYGITETALAFAWTCLDRSALGAGGFEPTAPGKGRLGAWLAKATRTEIITALIRAARDATTTQHPSQPHAEAA